MKTTMKKGTLTALSLAIFALVGIALLNRSNEPPPVSTASPPPRTAAVAPPLPLASDGATAPATQQAQLQVPEHKQPASKAQQFAQLVSTGQPADAYRATGLLYECRLARKYEKDLKSSRPGDLGESMAYQLKHGEDPAAWRERACGDLTDQQQSQMIVLLEKAAAAGVPSAALSLMREGPFGDWSALHTRPDDPLVLEWRKRMFSLIELAASKGDFSAMSTLADQYATGQGVGVIEGGTNAARALEYATAMHLLYESRRGKEMLGKAQQLAKLTARLKPEEAAKAREAGERLFAAAEPTAPRTIR